jgi:preprotein translocase subunit Sss1
MKRMGIVLLVIGLVGFVLASSQRGRYDSVEGALKSTFSSEERSKKEGWETARWASLGLAVVGLVLVVVPGKRA